MYCNSNNDWKHIWFVEFLLLSICATTLNWLRNGTEHIVIINNMVSANCQSHSIIDSTIVTLY